MLVLGKVFFILQTHNAFPMSKTLNDDTALQEEVQCLLVAASCKETKDTQKALTSCFFGDENQVNTSWDAPPCQQHSPPELYLYMNILNR